MGILDVLESLESSKPTKADAEAKHLKFLKAVKSWGDAQPPQSTETDYLRASGLYFTCPREFVLNYWKPRPNKTFDAKSYFLMGMGTYLHEHIQNSILGPMGLLKGTWSNGKEYHVGYYPDPDNLTWKYVENEVFDDQYHISGHLDGIISLDRIGWICDNARYMKKEPKKAIRELFTVPEGELVLLEIKTTASRVFKTIGPDTLPDYYRMQACVYQKLKKIYTTLFWYIDRDVVDSKVFMYEFEPGWWSDAKRKAKIIWESIRDEVLPDSMMPCKLPTDKRAKSCVFSKECFSRRLDFKQYVAEAKSEGESSGRVFLDLRGVDF